MESFDRHAAAPRPTSPARFDLPLIESSLSGSVAGGLGGAAAPPMMIEKLMIQLGARNLKTSEGAKNLKSSGGVGGGGSPPAMIDKVSIQIVAKHLKIAGGLGGQQPPP